MRAAIVLLAVSLSCASAVTSEAATLVNVDGVVTYTSGPGERDFVVAVQVEDGALLIRSNVIEPQVGGCTPRVPPLAAGTHEYRCPGVTSIVADLGDGDDWFGGIRTGLPMTVRGGVGDDQLSGDDTTAPVESADVLDGGPGEDALTAGRGDTVHGGTGVDTVITLPAPRLPISLSLDGIAGAIATVHPDVENATPGTTGPVTLTGTAAANELTGGDGDDRIVGGPGADVLIAAGGGDVIDARDGEPDRVDCGAGRDEAVVDRLDQVGDSCERVRGSSATARRDAPPTVERVGKRLVATDDRGLRRLRVYASGRVVCDDRRAPFRCPGPRRAVAVATDTSGQTTTVAPSRPRATVVNRDGVLTLSGGSVRSDLRVSGGTTVTVSRIAPYGTLEGSDPVLADRRTGDAKPLSAKGCERVAEPSPGTLEQFSCAGVRMVHADLGAGDDILLADSLRVPLIVDGGRGDDWINGGRADDSLSGGPGADQLWTPGAGRDLVAGGAGDDVLFGGPGDDVTGGTGIDAAYLSGAVPPSIRFGGPAFYAADVEDFDDTHPTFATRYLREGIRIIGTDAANRLVGGLGNDVIVGGRGSDTLDGYAGDDTIDARDGAPDRVLCGAGDDVALVDAVDRVADNCERVSKPS